MRKLLLTTAAVLTLGSGAIIANAQPAGLSAEQTSAYKAWSDDQRTSYDTWPVNYRTYYWTLTPPRQSGWWLLTDEQRARIYAMAEADRAAALDRVQAEMSARAAAPPPAPTVVETQANPQGAGVPSATPPNPMAAADPVPPAQPADPGYHAGPYKGALTPPPAEAMNKSYPVCSRTVQDNCRNRGGM